MRKRTLALVALVVALGLLAAPGCRRVPLERYSKKNEQRIPLDAAREVRAEIRMGAGELDLSGGAQGAMDAELEQDSRWVPEVDYSVTNGAGLLKVEQSDGTPRVAIGGMRHAVWDIRLTGDVPLLLDLELGAGESNLDLAGIRLRDLKVKLGAGETTIDLSAGWEHDVPVEIEAGVGQVNLTVPRKMGVRIVGLKDGVGDFDADGMTADGDAYVNEAYSRPGPKIEIEVQRGVGDIDIRMAD